MRTAMLLGLLLGATGNASAADVDLSAAATAIDQALATSRMPGLVVAITDREKVRRVFVHGFSDLKARTPLTADSRFAVGSVSKAFTAIALMELADEGRFDPRAPIVRYLPSFAVNSRYAPITGADLMTHTAGLPNYLVDSSSSRYVLDELKAFAPTYAPGSHFWYSNTGFQVLGYALEDIEKMPYDIIIRRRVFDPLGMKTSASVIDDSERTRMAVSYMRWPADGSFVEFPWFEYAAGDGSVVSDAADMSAYVRFYLNRGAGPGGRLLSEAAFAKLTTPRLSDYAYGLRIKKEGGATIVGHTGGIAGFHSEWEAHLEDGFGLVFLSNGGLDLDVQRWIAAVVTAAYHKTPLPAVPSATRDPYTTPLRDYAGSYGPVRFTVANDHLVFSQGNRTVPLAKMAPDTFRAPNGYPDILPFFFGRGPRDDGPEIIEVSHGLDWYPRDGQPARQVSTIPRDFAAYIGHYSTNGPEGPVARVFVRNGQLMMMVSADEAPELQPLKSAGAGSFRISEPDVNPERASFDSISNGHALRLVLSGVSLYRKDTP